VGIAKDVKNQQLFTNLYVGIAMDVKKINYYLQDLEVGITMDVKNQQLFMGPICKYYIFEMAL
jgi:hypothetical protein